MHCHEGLHPLLLKRKLALKVNRAWRWQLMAGLSNMISKTSRNTFYFCIDLSFKASCCCVLYHVPMLSIIVFAYYLYDLWIFFLHGLYAGSKELWARYCGWWEFHKVWGPQKAVLRILLEGKDLVPWGWVPWIFTRAQSCNHNELNEINLLAIELQWWNKLEEYCKGPRKESWLV